MITQHNRLQGHKLKGENIMTYSKEDWKNVRSQVTSQIIAELTDAKKETVLFKAVSKGVVRAFDEAYATAEKKAEFLTNPSVTADELFDSIRVSNKDTLVSQVVSAGILPENIAATLTGKQLQSLLDNYKG